MGCLQADVKYLAPVTLHVVEALLELRFKFLADGLHVTTVLLDDRKTVVGEFFAGLGDSDFE